MPMQLLTKSEVATRLGISRERVRALMARRADFPTPYAVAGSQAMPLWRPTDIDSWNETADRSTGRPRERTT